MNIEAREPSDRVDILCAYAAGEPGTLEFLTLLEARAWASVRVGPKAL